MSDEKAHWRAPWEDWDQYDDTPKGVWSPFASRQTPVPPPNPKENEMTEIPEDIAKVAGTLTVDIIESAPGIVALINTEELIARAILAEREAQGERDAMIVEAMSDALYEKADTEGIDGRDSAFAAWVVANVAAAIRTPA